MIAPHLGGIDVTHRPRIVRFGRRRPWLVAWLTPRGEIAACHYPTHAAALDRGNRAAARNRREVGSKSNYALAGPRGAQP